MSQSPRVFLLSPANCSGIRAGYLLRKEARFPLAERLRSPEGAQLGEVFSFMSGLYFRGKLAYARAFADPGADCPGIQVIVPGRGLCSPDTPITLPQLKAIARIPVDADELRYTRPLRRDAAALAARMHPEAIVILLGSIATPKYLRPLEEPFAGRLRFPREFIGRGDMSRGSIMLKCAAAGAQLTYIEARSGHPRELAQPARY